MSRRNRSLLGEAEESPELIEAVQQQARPLEDPEDLDPLLERIGDARYVLLGEASHGTSEYYMWRTALSQRLIEEKGFSFIAVEGDWPDCYRVNRYVKGYPHSEQRARPVLHAFSRWPTWMWANEEIVVLADWLRQHNDEQPAERQAGFYGLDVYSLWDSLYAIMGYLQRNNSPALEAARQAFQCFEPYGEDAQQYAYATRFVPETCEDEVLHLLQELRQQAPRYDGDREGQFVAEQNALVLKNAEAYYRAMIRGGPESWNIRDTHMTDTLDRLMQYHGAGAKGIVWEHNTHIGDARYTDMAEDGMVNIGQMTRQRHERDGVVLVGFGSYRGTVIAGREWDAPMERMRVPPGRPGSWEAVLHEAGASNKLLLFGGEKEDNPALETRGHRAIGVVYRPEYEQYGNYVPTVLPRRYDAFLYFDRSEALHPLHVPAPDLEKVPETYPSGV